MPLKGNIVDITFRFSYNLYQVYNGEIFSVIPPCKGDEIMKFKALRTSIVCTLLAAIVGLSPVYAATSPASQSTSATGSISGGALGFFSVPATAAFSNIQLNGDQQSAQASLGNIIAYDATGAGSGWNITVQAAPFTEVTPTGGYRAGTSAKTLPVGSLTLQAPNSFAAYSVSGNGKPTTSPLPTAVAGSPWAIDSLNGSSAFKVVTADTSKGMGGYLISFPANCLSLNLNPATTFVDGTNYAGQPTPYSTTITWTITTGP